jgi:small subunit ribosomal protein S6
MMAKDKAMKDYEVIYTIRPNIDEDAADKTAQSVDEYIKSVGGVVEFTDKKGRRRLAYEVDNMRDGYYVVTTFKAKPDIVVQIKRMMTLSEDILRSLIVVRSKETIAP